jgi:hypothetical protein
MKAIQGIAVGANGNIAAVKTVWIKGADGIPKLVTAYPGD